MDPRQNTKLDLNYFIIFLSCLLIFALRNSLNGVFYPTLLYEDSTSLFQPFYNGKGVGYIFETWNGYLYIIPKTIAFIFNYLPAKHIPSSYALISMIFAAITYVVLYVMLQGNFGKWIAVTCTLTIAALPLGYHLLVTNLAFSIWNMLLILIFLFFVPVPQTKVKRKFYCFVTVIMIWSHPLSLLLLPLYLYKSMVEPENKWIHRLFSFSTLLYFWFGMIPKAVDFSKLVILPKVLLEAIVVGSVLGPVKTAYIMTYDRMSIYATIILFFLVIFWGLFWSERSRREKELFIVSLYLIVSTIAFSILGGNNQYDFLIPWEPVRYIFTAKILFWVLLFSACSPLLKKSSGIVCVHALLIGFILINNTIGPYNGTYIYATSIQRGESVLEFVNRIPAYKGDCLDKPQMKEFIFKRKGSNDIRLKGCS